MDPKDLEKYLLIMDGPDKFRYGNLFANQEPDEADAIVSSRVDTKDGQDYVQYLVTWKQKDGEKILPQWVPREFAEYCFTVQLSDYHSQIIKNMYNLSQ